MVQHDFMDERSLLFGRVAISKGYVTEEQVGECLELREEVRALGVKPPSIANVFISRSYLTENQVVEIEALIGGLSGKREIEGYSLLGKIGGGAFGSVYRARQLSMDRIVALKILPRRLVTDHRYLDSFLSEAKLAARLSHENIVKIIDSGLSHGVCYFVMEFVEGETVGDTLEREGAMKEKRILVIAGKTAGALAHAHSFGIIHGDVKPANIIISSQGVPKLCDFGLAKDVARQVKASEEDEDETAGTPFYMAPEQIEGKPADVRTDIYSLGVSVYHMACGETPFDQNLKTEVLVSKILDEPVPPIREKNPRVSRGLEELVVVMMRKKPEERFQTIKAFQKAFRQVL